MSLTTEIHRKHLSLHVPTFKVTQGHWNRHRSIEATYDFLLVICNGPSSHRFLDGYFGRKSQTFPIPRVFIVPAEGIPLGTL